MASLKHYAPNDVSITVAGLYTVTGYAEGTFIRITKDTQTVSTIRAMDGTVSRIKSPDTGWRVEVTVAQSSSANDFFSVLWNVDRVTGLGQFPLFIKDNNGASIFVAATAWIEGLPQVVFSDQLETRTWVIGCTDVLANIGGASPSDIETVLGLGAAVLPVVDILKNFVTN